MAKTLKYIGIVQRWPELAFTGKQSVWMPGQMEERSDAEAAQLLGSGLFTSNILPVGLSQNASGGLALAGPDGVNNGLFQPSSKYMFFIPGQQFIGSGTAAKDKSGKAADAGFMNSLTQVNAYANPGFFTTGAGASLGLAIPSAKCQFDLSTESLILAMRIKKAAPVGAEAIAGCADASSIQGIYLSARAAASGVSKIRPIVNTSAGASGLSDSTATFFEATATDHMLFMGIDAVTKSLVLYCDGTLSDTYNNVYTGSTSVTVPFGFGFNTGTSGVTTNVCQFSGVHAMKWTGGLPLNIGVLAQKHAAVPHLWFSDSDMVF